MSIEDIEFIQANYKRWQFTKQQLVVLKFIMAGENWQYNISEISRATGCSRYIVRNTFSTISGYLEDFHISKNS